MAEQDSFIDLYVERARSAAGRIVFPEGGDQRIQEAATRIVEFGIADVILLAGADELSELKGCTVIDPGASPILERYAQLYATGPRSVSAAVAQRTDCTKVVKVAEVNLQSARLICCTFEPEIASPSAWMCGCSSVFSQSRFGQIHRPSNRAEKSPQRHGYSSGVSDLQSPSPPSTDVSCTYHT